MLLVCCCTKDNHLSDFFLLMGFVPCQTLIGFPSWLQRNGWSWRDVDTCTDGFLVTHRLLVSCPNDPPPLHLLELTVNLREQSDADEAEESFTHARRNPVNMPVGADVNKSLLIWIKMNLLCHFASLFYRRDKKTICSCIPSADDVQSPRMML